MHHSSKVWYLILAHILTFLICKNTTFFWYSQTLILKSLSQSTGGLGVTHQVRGQKAANAGLSIAILGKSVKITLDCGGVEAEIITGFPWNGCLMSWNWLTAFSWFSGVSFPVSVGLLWTAVLQSFQHRPFFGISAFAVGSLYLRFGFASWSGPRDKSQSRAMLVGEKQPSIKEFHNIWGSLTQIGHWGLSKIR